MKCIYFERYVGSSGHYGGGSHLTGIYVPELNKILFWENTGLRTKKKWFFIIRGNIRRCSKGCWSWYIYLFEN